MVGNKKAQAVIFGLIKVFALVVMGIFLLNIYGPFKDMAFSATTSLWVRIPILAVPIFYCIGILFTFVNSIRSPQ